MASAKAWYIHQNLRARCTWTGMARLSTCVVATRQTFSAYIPAGYTAARFLRQLRAPDVHMWLLATEARHFDCGSTGRARPWMTFIGWAAVPLASAFASTTAGMRHSMRWRMRIRYAVAPALVCAWHIMLHVLATGASPVPWHVSHTGLLVQSILFLNLRYTSFGPGSNAGQVQDCIASCTGPDRMFAFNCIIAYDAVVFTLGNFSHNARS